MERETQNSVENNQMKERKKEKRNMKKKGRMDIWYLTCICEKKPLPLGDYLHTEPVSDGDHPVQVAGWLSIDVHNDNLVNLQERYAGNGSVWVVIYRTPRAPRLFSSDGKLAGDII